MLLYYLSGILFSFMSIFLSFLSILMMIFKKNMFIEWTCLILESFMINMYIYIDWMCLMFMFIVLMISSMIMFYSSEYMNYDLTKYRFFYLVFLFIISMLLMILSPNLISILIGWDGLGLISYCLVIYYQSYSSYNSGMLTVLMNRIGDVFILLSLGMMMIFGSWNILNLNLYFSLLLAMIIIASFTKSAQFPFSSWLPAAMAAPTPVSSLVHSSTLVTAGVYLLIRFHYLIYKIDNLLFYILISGLITMVMAGMSANVEFDLKKIIAYSTLSQLGLMMMIIGMQMYELSFFHLLIHAMFKSMMFMCSGVMIHSMLNFQDIRYMGMIKNFMPLTSIIFYISNLALCGMPFFSGFYSKDLILEFMMMNEMNLFIYFLMMIGTGLTVSYSIRLFYYLMSNSFKFFPLSNLNDTKMMNYPMFILLIMSIFLGYWFNWILFMMIEEIYMLFIEKFLIIMICLIFIKIGIMNYLNKMKFNKFYFMKYFLGNMWFLYFMNKIFYKQFLIMGMFLNKIFDKGYLEWMFKNLLINYSMNFYNMFNKLNLNYLMNLLMVFSYLMMILLIIF